MMTDLELDIWNQWIREKQASLEKQLQDVSLTENPNRYYRMEGYMNGMMEALTMLSIAEDGKRFRGKLNQFRDNLLSTGDYDNTGNYKNQSK